MRASPQRESNAASTRGISCSSALKRGVYANWRDPRWLRRVRRRSRKPTGSAVQCAAQGAGDQVLHQPADERSTSPGVKPNRSELAAMPRNSAGLRGASRGKTSDGLTFNRGALGDHPPDVVHDVREVGSQLVSPLDNSVRCRSGCAGTGPRCACSRPGRSGNHVHPRPLAPVGVDGPGGPGRGAARLGFRCRCRPSSTGKRRGRRA